MDILVASSEVVPFAKTGGLADVTGALPRELAKLGHRVTVFLPLYRQCKNSGPSIEPTDIEFEIPIGSKLVEGRLYRSQLPDSDVVVYLVDQEDYFQREQLYGEDGSDYPDNCERFVFFCRAILESIRLLGLHIDLVHANDWQTGLLPALLKIELAGTPPYENIATLLTIHNLAYQGSFWHWDMLLTGLDWKYFNWREMEFFGNLNLLKTGIVFADAISTVSPTYAREIQLPEQGCGLDGVLQHRSDVLTGIINGIDPQDWNPKTDRLIESNYDVQSFETGKAACKLALQKEFHLETNPQAPMIGVVGRLATQKGWSLIISVMKQWLESVDTQWVILGTGQPEYHAALSALQRSHPDKVGLALEFSNALAHRIEAGADIFLMPSQYEPCGLNQMYSMAYGTVPVVRATGGLADTVKDANETNLKAGTANGFLFEDFDLQQFETALARAVTTYRQDKSMWNQLIKTGMTTDWSWNASAKKYTELYQQTIGLKLNSHQTA